MRVGFVTCVELGMACINTVLELGGTFDLIVTLKDSVAPHKSGRVFLDDLARTNHIDLVKVNGVNDSYSIDQIRRADLDVLFIIGWSQIAQPQVLELPRIGVFGMHPTLLPVGRGRASVPWAILKNLSSTGVTLFKLDAGVDTGPVVAQQVVPICEDETATTLYAKVTDAHVALMSKAWRMLEKNHIRVTPQDHAKATTWAGRTPSDGRIDPDAMNVGDVDRLVRATTHPYPGAYYVVSESQLMRVWAGSRELMPSDQAREIPVKGGSYYATEYSYEVADSNREPPELT